MQGEASGGIGGSVSGAGGNTALGGHITGMVGGAATGGAALGGSATGGSATGGATLGGTAGSGGVRTGGTAGSGGSRTGGTAGTGGTRTGGTSAGGDGPKTGGTAGTGGSAIGGSGGVGGDWPTFMPPNDLVWDNNITSDFFSGAFIGDGVSGAMAMADTKEANALRWLMGRYDVIAHQSVKDIDMVDPRLFAGSLILAPAGKPSKRAMRMALWDGEVTGSMTTDRGSLSFRSFVQRDRGVFVIELRTTGGESAARLFVREEWGVSPSFYHKKIDPETRAAELAPKPTTSKSGDYTVITQPLVKNGAHAVAWTLTKPQPDVQILYAAIGVSYNPSQPRATDEQNARSRAITALDGAVKVPFAQLSDGHQSWWHQHLARSRLTLPDDPAWQRFWWQQIYKFASASREDSSLMIDNSGAWAWNSGWGGLWWNLNLQLSYTPMYVSNRLDVGRSLFNGMDRIYRAGQFNKNAGSLASDSVFVGRSTNYLGDSSWGELGNMTWMLFDVWRMYRYSMDDSVAKWLFPILKQDVNYYLHKLSRKANGQLELEGMSPEFENVTNRWTYPNPNYAIASLRWALAALIELNDRYAFADSKRSEWAQTLKDLIPLPAGSNGLKIGSDQEYTASHRHYSHLLALYPYHLVNPEQDATQRTLYQRSVDHWTSMPNAFAGYSYTGAAAMYATLGDGEKAITWLDKLKSKLTPNTMYHEGGSPVIETPLSAVDSLNYMLLQSWGGTVRVFPAVPARWKAASFANFLAEGAFEVSAQRGGGQTTVVKVRSLAGSPLRLSPGFDVELAGLVVEPASVAIQPVGNRVYTIALAKGQEVTLRRR